VDNSEKKVVLKVLLTDFVSELVDKGLYIYIYPVLTFNKLGNRIGIHEMRRQENV
jgi:hypothetical protein